MIGGDFDDLGRALARRASRRSLLSSALRAGTPQVDEARIDTLSRALAVPMSRRRAIGVVSGTLIAGSVLRPRFAGAADAPPCPDGAPQKCVSTMGAAQVCVENDWHCCSNTVCAGACKPWENCVKFGTPESGCDDTAQLCVDPRVATAGRSTFCFESRSSQSGICHGDRTLKYGWCCRPGDKCGPMFGGCTCKGEDCGRLCCKPGEYCDVGILGNECKKWCDEGRKIRRCGWDCCTSHKHCGSTWFGTPECQCTSPLVNCGTGCCDPKQTPEDPKVRDNFIDNWFDMARSTSASHGGAHSSAHLSSAYRAQTAAGTDAALLALAAVSAQGGAALVAFTDGHRDSAFKRKVVPARPSRPKLQAGTGLDAGSASALDALFAADVRASALIAAAATALARSRGAIAKHDRARARTQLLASARFADQAAKALKGVPALRAAAVTALRAGKTLEVIASPDDIGALQASVRRSGLPAELRAQLAGLGVAGKDLDRVRAGMLHTAASPDTMAGAVLIAPLDDAGRTKQLQNMTSELARYATRARRHPIARGHG